MPSRRSRFADRIESWLARWLSRPAAPGALAIVPFRGFGNQESLSCRGRVLEKRGIVRVRDRDTFLHNLHKMFRRFTSRPGSGAEVRVRIGEVATDARATEDGFFRAELPGSDGPGPEIPVEMELVHPPPLEPVRATGHVFLPPASAELGVITDIDDTILRTDAFDRLRMARIVLFGNARSRLPFPGVRAFYRALHGGRSGSASNPFYYVSSSSWHIYDVLHDFIELHELPRGPILLRDLQLTRASLFGASRHDHKLLTISEILETCPDLPFLLIGDSGQKDAELYCEIVGRYPGRILAIYIRDVLPTPRRRETIEAIARSIESKGANFLLVDDTLQAARHAAGRGFLAPERVEEIERDEVRDEPKNPVSVLLYRTGRAVARLTRPWWLRRD